MKNMTKSQHLELEMVPYDLGMALKDSGYDILTQNFYYDDVQCDGKSLSFDDELDLIGEGREDEIYKVEGGRIGSHYGSNSDDWMGPTCCSAPTLALAEKWLRDKCGLLVQLRVAVDGGKAEYTYTVTNLGNGEAVDGTRYSDTPEGAERDGIWHALELLGERK